MGGSGGSCTTARLHTCLWAIEINCLHQGIMCSWHINAASCLQLLVQCSEVCLCQKVGLAWPGNEQKDIELKKNQNRQFQGNLAQHSNFVEKHFDDYDDFNIVITIILNLWYFQKEFGNFNRFRLKLSIFNIIKEIIINWVKSSGILIISVLLGLNVQSLIFFSKPLDHTACKLLNWSPLRIKQFKIFCSTSF